MARTNGTDDAKRPVSSLSELLRDVAPPRDLWPDIASEIAKTGADAKPRTRRRIGATPMQWGALAAVVSALAVGIWLGRAVLPGSTSAPAPAVVADGTPPSGQADGPNGAAGGQQVLAASFVTDPRYLEQRAVLIAALEEQLNTLPPETQQKVANSLKTIRESMNEIHAALGRDPANALLQELLVNTYQDEMRVLTAVHEASDAARGI